MEFVDVCKQYFQAFQEKDIEIIERMVHQSIELRDWELMVSGKDDFIDANKKIYLLLILSNKFASRLVIIFTPIVI